MVLPTLVSTEWGRLQTLKLINAFIPGKISCSNLEIGWFTDQWIQEVELKDAQDHTLFKMANLRIQAPLYRFFLPQPLIEHVSLESPWLSLEEDACGHTNLEKALYRVNPCETASQASLLASLPDITLAWGTKQRIVLRAPFRGTLALTDGFFSFRKEEGPATELSHLEALCTSFKDQGVLDVSLKGQSQRAEIKGNFELSFHVVGLSRRGYFHLFRQETKTKEMTAHLQLDHWPVALLDELLLPSALSGLGTEALGPSLSLNADLRSGNPGLQAVVSLQSLQAEGDVMLTASGQALVLSAPSKFTWKVTPAFVANALERLGSVQDQQARLVLTQQASVSLVLDDLTLPLEEGTPMIDKMACHGHLLFDPLQLTSQEGNLFTLPSLSGTLSTDHLEQELVVDVHTLSHRNDPRPYIAFTGKLSDWLSKAQCSWEGLHWPLQVFDALAGTHEFLMTSFGPTMDVRGSCFKEEDHVNFSMRLAGDHVQADINATTDDGKRWHIVAPTTLSYELTPAVLQKLAPSLPALDRSSNFRMVVDPFSFSMHRFSLSKLFFQGSLEISSLPLFSQKIHLPPTATRLSMRWQVNGPNNLIAASFSNHPEASPTVFKGRMEAKEWLAPAGVDFSQASFNATLSLRAVPSEWMAVLIGDNALSALLDKELDVTLAVDRQAQKAAFVNLKVKGESLDLEGNYLVDEEGLSQPASCPTKASMTLSPLQFQEWQNRKGWNVSDEDHQPDATFNWTMTHPTQVQWVMNSFCWPIFAAPTGSSPLCGLQGLQLDSALTIDRLTLVDASGQQQAELRDFSMTLQSAGVEERLQFTLKGETQSLSPAGSSKGFLDFKGALDHWMTPRGEVDTRSLSARLTGEVSHFPVPLLVRLFSVPPGAFEPLDALLGSTVDIQLSSRLDAMRGVTSVKVQGQHSRLNIDAEIANGYLTLTQPLEGTIDVTPELSKHFLNFLNPLLVTAVASDHPISIRIEPANFRLPVAFWALEEVEIGSATIDVGRVTATEGGSLSSLLQFLKQGRSGHHSLWFTPQYLSLHQGILHVERVDYLIDDALRIATWGQVDLLKDKVDITVAVMASTLGRAFHLTALPQSDMLLLHMRGSTSHPRIDTKQVASNIATLITKHHANQSVPFLKDILSLLTGPSNKNVPPPTASPFPWEQDADWQERTGGRADSYESQPNSAPKPTHLEDKAKSLLKNFLKHL